MDFPFKSTKTFRQAFPVAYRQWRADSHCNVLHGYALTIHLEFGGFDLDARNWLVDFGGLRALKGQLEDWFDHTTLVAQDDPEVEYLRGLHKRQLAKITEVERTGCEGLADFIFEHLNDGWLRENGYGDRVICTKVEVRETDANMAMRCLSVQDYVRFCGLSKPSQDENVIVDHYGGAFINTATPHSTLVVFNPGGGYYASTDRSKLYLKASQALEALQATLNKD